nr:nucleotidyl transferase AbiEii/AbiGii toxin family protein [uncultured Shinella sp.]
MQTGVRSKGGTSLSKGYRIINRFSEDIDIRIEPPKAMNVKTSPNHDKPAHRESRKAFYEDHQGGRAVPDKARRPHRVLACMGGGDNDR